MKEIKQAHDHSHRIQPEEITCIGLTALELIDDERRDEERTDMIESEIHCCPNEIFFIEYKERE